MRLQNADITTASVAVDAAVAAVAAVATTVTATTGIATPSLFLMQGCWNVEMLGLWLLLLLLMAVLCNLC